MFKTRNSGCRLLLDDERTELPELTFQPTTGGAGATKRKTRRVVDAVKTTTKRKRASSRAERFPKTLFALSRCRIAEDDGSGDLLSQPQVHAGDRDEADLAAQQQMQKIRGAWTVGFLFSGCAAAAVRIYRKTA